MKRTRDSTMDTEIPQDVDEFIEDNIPLKKLYVSSLPRKATQDDLFRYFSQFGRVVNAVRVNTKPPLSFGFVEFVSSKDAFGALWYRNHRIFKMPIHVDKADIWQQPDQKLSRPTQDATRHSMEFCRYGPQPIKRKRCEIEPAKENSGLSLLQLNNHCLMEICSSLSLEDLSAIAETCTQLKAIATRLFTSTHKELILKPKAGDLNLSLRATVRILRNFGNLLTSMRVSCMDVNLPTEIYLYFINYYCSATLETLRLHKISVEYINDVHVKLLFGKLKKLVLDCSSLKPHYLSYCKTLVALKMMKMFRGDHDSVLQNKFPRLKSFKYTVCYDDTTDSVCSFIEYHKGINELTLRGFSDINAVLSTIGQNLKKLEKLCILPKKSYESNVNKDSYSRSYEHLAQLNHLTKLIIYGGNQSISTFINHTSSAESLMHLKLNNIKADDLLLTGLNKLKNLHTLQLKNISAISNEHIEALENLDKLYRFTLKGPNITASGVVSLVKKLPNLQLLILRNTSFICTPKIYNIILQICRYKRKLTIINLEYHQDDIPDCLFGNNRDFVDFRRYGLYTKLDKALEDLDVIPTSIDDSDESDNYDEFVE